MRANDWMFTCTQAHPCPSDPSEIRRTRASIAFKPSALPWTRTWSRSHPQRRQTEPADRRWSQPVCLSLCLSVPLSVCPGPVSPTCVSFSAVFLLNVRGRAVNWSDIFSSDDQLRMMEDVKRSSPRWHFVAFISVYASSSPVSPPCRHSWGGILPKQTSELFNMLKFG